MSQLLCYWEEADRCLNQGEVKIKTHCPLHKLLLRFSSHSKAFMLVNQPLPFSVAFRLLFILANAAYSPDTPWVASLALGYQICSPLLHPVNGVPKWWQIIVLKKFVKKLCFDEFVYFILKNYEICRFNNKKNMPLANLIHKVKSQQLFKNIYKRNLNVKCVCYSAFETSCTTLSNFLILL